MVFVAVTNCSPFLICWMCMPYKQNIEEKYMKPSKHFQRQIVLTPQISHANYISVFFIFPIALMTCFGVVGYIGRY